MSRPKQECLQCGLCCERWGWGQRGKPEDLVPWITGMRHDILRHVLIRFSDGRKSSGIGITLEDLPRISRIYYWQDGSGRKMRKCPFLKRSKDGKALCGIHEVKPWVCRDFTPWNWENNEFYGNCPACMEKSP